MIPRLTERLLAGWESFFEGQARPSELSYVAVPGSLEGGTCTFLGFADGSDKPSFAVKLHRHPEDAGRAAAELELLTHVRSRPSLARTVPRPLFHEGHALVQTFMDGIPLPASVAPSGAPVAAEASRNFSLAAGWLSELHERTYDARAGSIAALSSRVKALPAAYAARFQPSALLNEAAARVGEAGLGGVAQHGDFTRHNILLNDGALRVIDWSDGRALGLPLHDLYFFLSTYYLQLRKTEGLAGFLDAFQETFLGSSPYSRLVRETIERFCLRVKIPLELRGDLLVLFLAERALFEAAQVERCVRRGQFPRFRVALAESNDPADVAKAQVWSRYLEALAAGRGDVERVSVIIPCLNEASTIGRCVESVVENGFEPSRLEVLVVDGGSTDGTVDRIRELQERHPSIRLLSNPRRIIPAALNIGIREAAGKIVIRLDAHAAMDPGYISECAALLRENPGSLVGGRMRTLPRAATLFGGAIAAALSARFGVGDSAFRLPVDKASCDLVPVDTLPFWAGRKETLASIGGFDERLARSEDIDFSIRLAQQGVKKLLSPRTACTYYARSSLRELWSHSLLNGVWAILPFRYCAGLPVRPRHLVPLAFVLALIAAALAGAAPLLLLTGIYAAFCLSASLLCAIQRREPALVLLMPVALAVLHLAYGLGSLAGVAMLPAGRREAKPC